MTSCQCPDLSLRAHRFALRPLDPGTPGTSIAGDVISNYGFNPSRITWMADYNPSEFSHIRLQMAHDESQQGLTDNEIFLQYIMSIGA